MPPVPPLIRWVAGLALSLLVVLTILRGAAYLAFRPDAVTWAQAGPAFWLGWRFDVRVVATAMLVLLALGAWPGIGAFRGAVARRGWLTALGVFGAALAVFYTCDFLHFSYLNQRLNASALSLLADTKISATMIWETYPVVRLLLVIGAATAGFVLLARRLHARAAAGAIPGRRWARGLWYGGAVAGCVVGVFGRVGQYPLRWSDAFALRNDFSAHLALNPVESFLSSLSFRASGYEAREVGAHYLRMAAYLGIATPDPARLPFERHVPARPAAISGAARPPNIVLVICESFSGYKSSMWGNPLDTTPFFAELCRQGIFFDNCYTPHVGTARGVWATITGIPDVEMVETASRNPALVDQHTIIGDFAGYEKLYFLGGSTSWANIRGVLTANIPGLQLFETGYFKSPRVDVWGISDKSLFLEAHEVLRAQTRPFFAVIQTAGNHRPYTIPHEDLKEFSRIAPPEGELKAAGFDTLAELNAFRYSDYTFRKFIEAAKSAPYFNDTIFVFVGDHGIGGNAGSRFPPAWTDQQLTRYHVPLLFYAPGRLAPQRLHSVASQVDVLPTIAGLAGVAHRNATLGRDLLRQQQIDGGRSNAAFIVDHNTKTIGLIQGSHYGTRHLPSGRVASVWADFTAPAGGRAVAPEGHAQLATAFYETARFLLRHNRKPAAVMKGAD
ncbi:MAG: sulfatase-like hydrolase/transferase [Opitutaceae bacterium]|nr:sulfatase-like hydrolase/transferase [Opitutaceae bacterium]